MSKGRGLYNPDKINLKKENQEYIFDSPWCRHNFDNQKDGLDDLCKGSLNTFLPFTFCDTLSYKCIEDYDIVLIDFKPNEHFSLNDIVWYLYALQYVIVNVNIEGKDLDLNEKFKHNIHYLQYNSILITIKHWNILPIKYTENENKILPVY